MKSIDNPTIPNKRFEKHYLKKQTRQFFLTLINCLFWLFITFPLIYAVLLSLKSPNEIYDPNSFLFPQNPTFSNYFDVFRMIPLGHFMLNSLIVASLTTFSQILNAYLASFSFHFYNFKYKKLLYLWIISTTIIPGETVIISKYLMVSSWNLSDTLVALIIPSLIGASDIFFCTQSMEKFPYEIYESAKIDGCSDLKFIWSILFPMMKPTTGVMAVRSFLAGWNMYMWPLLITNSSDSRPVQVGISMLNNVESQSLVLMIAGVVISMIPSLFIFILGRKSMIKGLTAGAVKG